MDAIEQSVYKVDKANKRKLLIHLLRENSWYSVLVFTATKHGADRVAKELNREQIGAMAIHGNKSQTARVKALSSFKEGAIRVLVATDIAARGIDIHELPLVINFDLPNVPETYVHRIGRTGRAGRSGLAISFCNSDELAYLRDIEKLTKQAIPVIEDHPWPMEVFEATLKQPRPPRPAKQLPQANARKQPGEPEKSAPKQPEPARAPAPKPVPVKQPPAANLPETTHFAQQSAAQPSKSPARKYRSDPFAPPGKVVAFADGRRRPRRRSPGKQQ